MIYGATDDNTLALPARHRALTDRMTAFGIEFLVPQYPDGRRANPTPEGLPPGTPNVRGKSSELRDTSRIKSPSEISIKSICPGQQPLLALRLAEVDGNRTRRTGITHPTRFEGGGAHQALGHLHTRRYSQTGNSRRCGIGRGSIASSACRRTVCF